MSQKNHRNLAGYVSSDQLAKGSEQMSDIEVTPEMVNAVLQAVGDSQAPFAISWNGGRIRQDMERDMRFIRARTKEGEIPVVLYVQDKNRTMMNPEPDDVEKAYALIDVTAFIKPLNKRNKRIS